jgi:hypothetical protein
VFPYLAVGKLPQAVGLDWWDSRHQVLVPLGAALMLYGGVMLLGRVLRLEQSVTLATLVLLIAAFMVFDVRTSLAYQADWYKQVSLMKHMETSRDIRSGNYIVVRDEAVGLNVAGRRYLPYELSGMMFKVFGDASRFGVDEAIMPIYAFQLTAYGTNEQYHWSQYRPPARAFLVRVTPGAVDLSSEWTLLGLMWRERLLPQEFDRLVRGVVAVETAPALLSGQ